MVYVCHETAQKVLDRFNSNFAQIWVIYPGVTYAQAAVHLLITINIY